MLGKAKTFSSFAVRDIKEAKEFYQNVIGIEVKDNPMGVAELHVADNTPVVIYPKEDHKPATFTVLNFRVKDVGQSVAELTEAGVKFEHYEDMGTDEKGIMNGPDGHQIAWFKDPSGNILSIIKE